MRKIVLIATIFVIAGLIMITIAGCAGVFGKNEEITETTYNIDEAFTDINIEASASDFEIKKSETGKSYVTAQEKKNLKFGVSVSGGALTIEEIDERRWFEHIGISFSERKSTLYLSEPSYNSLDIEVSSGNIVSHSDIAFKNAAIELSSGKLDFHSPVSEVFEVDSSSGNIDIKNGVAESLEINTSSGHITLSDIMVKSLNIDLSSGDLQISRVLTDNISIDVSSGSTKLTDVISNVKTEIHTSSGNITFEKCDSPEFLLECTSGKIEGTLLTGKIFDVRTSSGNSDYPESIEGHGKFKATTSSGDIKIRIAE